MTTIFTGRGRAARQLFGVFATAGLAVLIYFGWLGSEAEQKLDPVTGTYSGPYHWWQIAGCAVSLLALLVGALLAGVRPVVASAALTVAFTAAWTATAAADDDTGLFMVGAGLLFIGLAAGCAVVCGAAAVVRTWRGRRHS